MSIRYSYFYILLLRFTLLDISCGVNEGYIAGMERVNEGWLLRSRYRMGKD